MQTEITSVQKSQEVSALLAVPNSRIIAGGTTFAATSEQDLHLVDISTLEGLDGIKQKGNRIELGPLTTLESMEASALLKKYFPALAEASALAGTPEIRKKGTLGGNLASPRIGDTAPALLACGAKLTIKTDTDFRELLIDRFWDQNGKNDLQYDEWITRITLQLPKDSFWGAAYGKYGEWDLTKEPSVSAAVQLSLDGNDVVTAVRGGLRTGSHNIRRMFGLEKALKNHPASEENLEKAVRAMLPAAQDVMEEKAFAAFLTEILQRVCAQAKERRAL